MEALSAAASILTIIEISGKLFASCRTYYLSVKDARTDIARFKSELTALEAVLTNIVDLVELSETGLSIISLLNEQDGPIAESQAILTQIIAKLENVEPESKMKRFGLRALKWPFTSKEIDRFIEILQRNKALFAIAMSGDILSLTLALKSGIEEITGKLQDTYDLVALTRKDIDGTREFLEATEALERARKDGERRNKIMAWLTKADPSSNHQAACQKHEPGTGKWILERKEFKDWEVSENSVLWVHGIAGCGKTIISSTIIEHIKIRCKEEPNAILAFFYFDFSNPTKQKIENCFASLIAQLCRQSPNVPEQLHHLYAKYEEEKTAPSIFDLRRIFDLLISQQATRDIFLVLDALDECPNRGENERGKLLQAIEEIHTSSSSNIHLLVTSRVLNDIQNVLLPFIGNSRISVEVSDSKEDIGTFVSSQLLHDPLLNIWPEGVKAEIEKVLLDTCDGMFRWAYCQLQTIRKFKQKRPLLKALGCLPKTLNETYDRMVQEIDQEDQDLARRALLWLAFADRALRVGELAEAMILGLDTADGFDFEDRLHKPYNDVLEILGSFVTILPHNIDEDEEVDDIYKVIKLAHFSVKEYILSQRDESSTLRIPFATAQIFCARTCLSYILHWSDSVSRKMSIHDFAEFPLLRYACGYWHSHIFEIPQRDRGVLDHQLECLFLTKAAFWECLTVDDPMSTSGPFETDKNHCSPLFYAAWLGLSSIVAKLLDNNVDPAKSFGRKGRTPLHIAAITDREGTIIRLLLDCSVVLLEMEDQHGYTALQNAAMADNHVAVSILLQYHANPDSARDRDGNTALMYAAARDHIEVIKILVNAGANINISDDDGHSALSWGAWNGCGAAFRLLVDAGATTKAQEMNGKTLLHRASESGSAEIAKILLDLGADILALDQDGRPPLHYSRNIPMVDILLSHGADIHGLDYNERSCLHAVAERGQAHIIRYLIEKGATVYVVDKFGQTPLHAAIPNEQDFYPTSRQRLPPYRSNLVYKTVEYGEAVYESVSSGENVDAVEALVTWNIDIIDHQDLRSQTALHICTNPLVAEILIRHGASLNHQDERYMTPLIRAADEQNLEVLDVLLRYKPDVQFCDDAGDTALHCFIKRLYHPPDSRARKQSRWHRTFHGLLDHGVNLEAKNKMGVTVLMLMAAHHQVDTLGMKLIAALLEKGSDVNAQSADGRTALHYTCGNRNADLESVKLLLKHGGSMESRDCNGRTPLHLAAICSAIPNPCQILLKSGADVNAVDKEGNTPIDLINRTYSYEKSMLKGNQVVLESWILNHAER